LRDDLIRRGDQLPNFEDAVARLGGYDWLSKNPSGYAADAESKLKRSRSCAYMTQLRGRYVQRTPDKKLGANCRAQTGSPD